MTDEEIDAVFAANHNPMESPWVNWRRFAREVALVERERCANICEARAADHEESAETENDERFDVYAKHERRCAIAIRAG